MRVESGGTGGEQAWWRGGLDMVVCAWSGPAYSLISTKDILVAADQLKGLVKLVGSSGEEGC